MSMLYDRTCRKLLACDCLCPDEYGQYRCQGNCQASGTNLQSLENRLAQLPVGVGRHGQQRPEQLGQRRQQVRIRHAAGGRSTGVARREMRASVMLYHTISASISEDTGAHGAPVKHSNPGHQELALVRVDDLRSQPPRVSAAAGGQHSEAIHSTALQVIAAAGGKHDRTVRYSRSAGTNAKTSKLGLAVMMSCRAADSARHD